MTPEIRVYKNPNEVAAAFAGFLIKTVNRLPQPTISLSGGSTPKLLFQHLASSSTSPTDWEKVHFFWGDERCVPPDHEESNFKMTNDFFFGPLALNLDNVHRVRGEANPEKEANRYGKLLQEVCAEKNGLPAIDLMVLGMGDDGHTASIFPNRMQLLSSERICEVANHPVSGQQRVTMTGQVIKNASEIVFLVTGENKAEKVRSILNETPGSELFPAAHIKGERVFWFMDEAAASLMNP